MPRIFAFLALSDALILLGTGVFGLFVEGPQVERHILLAVFALVVTCFIQAVFFTYFAVTGKLLVQAVTLGRMDPGPIAVGKSLKREASIRMGVLVTAVLATGATGAARWGGMVPPWAHLATALLGLTVVCWAFLRQYDLVSRNAELIERTMREYESVRRGRQEAEP